ncbi:MAG TPA: folylpolyglutamate synthase/dihydrofolate synthase family protein [Thermodesulfovibrionales bacterium]|nr:folylpolyglutamate synthase/dihydrofolate synthase family protein [Thermodesulfovibrionales bacterium]
MKYSDTIDYLYSLQKHGIKLGLENTLRLLSLLRNPQDSFKSIHVAGTNGKGSTSAMIASVLRAAGFKVGLFTSPHMVSFTERIKVNDVEIEEKEVVELTREIRGVIQESQKSEVRSLPTHQPSAISHQPFLPTFFEFVTATGLLYFKRNGVEWAVVETGMGGRLDATNVLTPAVSVVTNIGYDHREFLGETLREIAAEKAGIIKRGVPVVSSSQNPDAMEVIVGNAADQGAGLFVYGKEFASRPESVDMYGATFDYEGKERLDSMHIPLSGMHQIENASVAIKTMELIAEKESIPSHFIREGLARTQWLGRLELIKDAGHNCDFLVDGAHNPSASVALADSLKRYFLPSYQKVILVIGIMGDKDVEGILGPLLPLASELIFAAPAYERAASPEKLADYAGGLGFSSTIVKTIKDAIGVAVRMALKKTLVVITGSFYTIGEAKAYLGQECHAPSLAELR